MKQKRKIQWPSLMLFLIFVSGLSLLVYPSLSDWWNSFHATRSIEEYEEAVLEADTEEYEQIKQEALRFNQSLLGSSSYALSKEQKQQYYSTLNITPTGIMCWISIPALEVQLPVYHGTDASVLQSGAGHLEGSSLPVGGRGSHAVISAHSGLTTARLFTGLDLLQTNDLIYINVLGNQLVYEVKSIEVVLPEQMDSLAIQPDEDELTLVTCTPYGINSHRLLVHAYRSDQSALQEVRAEAMQVSSNLVSLCFCIPMVLLVLFVVSVRAWKVSGKGGAG